MFVTVRHYSDKFRRDINGCNSNELLEIARECYNTNNYIRVADMEIGEEGSRVTFMEIAEEAYKLTNSFDGNWTKSKDRNSK